MSEKIKLSDDGLENVIGGESHAERTCKFLPSDHGKFIDIYEAEHYIGQKVYIVKDGDREVYYWGILNKSFEQDNFFGGTTRAHEISVEGCNNYMFTCEAYVGTTQTFNSNYFSLYLYN